MPLPDKISSLYALMQSKTSTVAVAVTEATARTDAMTTPSILGDRWRRACTAFTRRAAAKEPDHGQVRLAGNQSQPVLPQ